MLKLNWKPTKGRCFDFLFDIIKQGTVVDALNVAYQWPQYLGNLELEKFNMILFDISAGLIHRV